MGFLQWLGALVAVVLVGFLLLRGRRDRPDPNFLPARLSSEKQMSFARLLELVVLVLVALSLVWFLLNAEFGGIVFHFALAGK